jgi:hypothetical protein
MYIRSSPLIGNNNQWTSPHIFSPAHRSLMADEILDEFSPTINSAFKAKRRKKEKNDSISSSVKKLDFKGFENSDSTKFKDLFKFSNVTVDVDYMK